MPTRKSFEGDNVGKLWLQVLFISNPRTAKLLHNRSLYPDTIDRGVEEQMKHFDAVSGLTKCSNIFAILDFKMY
jgi:hypothetical protein